MKSQSRILGVLGGLGPMSSAYFYELITKHTLATCDQQHMDILISSKATTPDRTMFISGMSTNDPLPVMIAEINRLTKMGASIIAIPCNTAQHFYNALCLECDVPILNIVDLTVQYASFLGIKSLGIMATNGTILSEAYKKSCEQHNIQYITPAQKSQYLLSELIYSDIKSGIEPHIRSFDAVADELFSNGSDCLILGCTELSLIKRSFNIDYKYIDSLDVLTACTIAVCGKEICKYPSSLIEFAQVIARKDTYL